MKDQRDIQRFMVGVKEFFLLFLCVTPNSAICTACARQPETFLVIGHDTGSYSLCLCVLLNNKSLQIFVALVPTRARARANEQTNKQTNGRMVQHFDRSSSTRR